jgi:hypothetical protein
VNSPDRERGEDERFCISMSGVVVGLGQREKVKELRWRVRKKIRRVRKMRAPAQLAMMTPIWVWVSAIFEEIERELAEGVEAVAVELVVSNCLGWSRIVSREVGR